MPIRVMKRFPDTPALDSKPHLRKVVDSYLERLNKGGHVAMSVPSLLRGFSLHGKGEEGVELLALSRAARESLYYNQ